MIPSFLGRHGIGRAAAPGGAALLAIGLCAACGSPPGAGPKAAANAAQTPGNKPAPGCLSSGDGYLRAKLGGAVEAQLDWPNSGTECQGESRGTPPGVRLSFHRESSQPNLLLVFGLTGVQRGQPAREVAANVTVIVQGTSQIYGTLGDSRCTVDTLEQQPLAATGAYRIEARGFCTQPAHAVHGSGDVLVSTFEFAGPVQYEDDTDQI
jgi:hypothetical protein